MFFIRFYNHDSSFVHGCLKERLPQAVHGQQQIHQKIIELDFNDCKAKILLVDSHRTLDNGVVVQVSLLLVAGLSVAVLIYLDVTGFW